MGFSPKRLKQLRKGQVVFNIYDDKGALVASHPSFMAAVRHVEVLQQTNPGIKYDMKVESIMGSYMTAF